MSDFISKVLSPGEIKSLEDEVIEEAQTGRKEAAWHKLHWIAHSVAAATIPGATICKIARLTVK